MTCIAQELYHAEVEDLRTDPKDGKATRVRFDTVDGKKVRVAARSGEKIDG